MALPAELLDILHNIQRHLPFREERDANAMRDAITALNPPTIVGPESHDANNVVDAPPADNTPPELSK